MSDNGDLKLIATLDENSSEAEIIKAIQILNGRLKSNANAKIKLDSELDVKSVQKVIKKLETLLNSKNLSVNTKDSILSIQKEAEAMLGVVSSANKASKEKLEFANANKKVAESANNTSKAIANERNAMQSLDDLDYILRNINMQGKTGNTVFQQFGNTLRDAFYAFTAANLLQDAIYKVIDGGKEAVGTVKELNDAAVSLRMATGDSYNSVKQLMSDYNAMAQELGAVTTSVSEAADEWLRQGHTIEDTNTLIEDSMMLSKVSELKSADSTKYLTSAMQGYKVAVEDVVGIVDKLSAVDLESATDAGGLAEAMSRTAEGAQIAGISMDRLLGMIATVGEVTQKSMSSIGESYKTVFSRMRDIKDNKLSVIGEDGEIEDLSNVEIVLDSLGIKLRDSNLEFRNFQDVLDDVANSWDTYSSVQKAAIAKAFSGVRQQENFLVMMENWDKVVKYTDVASKSEGTASEKFGYYLEGLEAKTNSLKASLENLASTTISDELYGSVLDTTQAIVNMTSESGILKGALAGLGTAGAIYAFQQLAGYMKNVTQEFSNFGQALSITRNGQVGIDEMQDLINLTGGLTQSQTRLLLSTNNLTDAQKAAVLMNQRLAQGLPQITEEEALQQVQTMGVATAQGTATGTTISLTSAMRGLWSTLMANPLVLVTTAVTVGVMAWNRYKQAQEEARQTTIELTNTYKQEKESIDSQIESYKELKEKLDNGNLSTDETRSIKEQLLEIQKSLIDSFGDEASNIDLVNGKYKEQLGLLSELSKEKASEYVKENRSAFETAKKELEKTRSYEVGSLFSYDSNKGMSDEQKQLYDYIKSYSDLFEIKRLYDTSTLSNSDYAPTLFVNANADDAKEIIDKFYDDIEKYIKDNNLQLDYDSLQIDLSKVSSDIETDDALKEYRTIYDEFMKAEIVRNDTLRPLYQQSIQAVEDYNNALSNGEGISEAKANLDSVQQSVQNATGELEGSQDIFNSIFEGINKDAETVYNLNKAFKTDKTVQSYAEQLRGLSDIDLKAINFDNDNTEKGEEAFRGLMETLGLTEEQVQSLIDKLVELGYVQGEVQTQSDVESVNILSFSDAWEQLKNSTKDTTKGLADDLTKLAEAGQLTSEALSEADTSEFFKNAGISAEEATKQINALVSASTQLNALSGQITKMSDMLADKKNGTVASASDLAGFDAEVQGLDSWEEFEKVMGSAESTMEQCQKAANDLATEWVNSNNFLAQLTKENKDYYITQLDKMGVENAEAVVLDSLKYKQEALAQAESFVEEQKIATKDATYDLSDATAQEINKFAEEQGMVGNATLSLLQLALKKQLVNGATLDFSGDITNIKNYVSAIGGAITALSALEKLKSGAYVPGEYKEQIEENIKKKAQAEVDAALNKVKNVDIKVKSNGTSNKGSGKSGGGGKSGKDKDSKKEIDWIARALETIQQKIELTKTKFENLFTFNSKKNNLAKQIKDTTTLLEIQTKAAEDYKDVYDGLWTDKKKVKGKTVSVPSKYAKLLKKAKVSQKDIENGRYKGYSKKDLVKEYGQETADAIEALEKYYDAYQTQLKEAESTLTTLRQLQEEQYQLYVDKYDAQKDLYESEAESVSSAKDKNKYLEKEISAIKSSYNYQVKIALLNGDVTEAQKLRLEQEKEILEVMKQQLENIQNQHDATIEVNDAKSQNADNATKKALAEQNATEYDNAANETSAYIGSSQYKKDLKEAATAKSQALALGTTQSSMQKAYGTKTKGYSNIEKAMASSSLLTSAEEKEILQYIQNGEQIPDKYLNKLKKSKNKKDKSLYNKLKSYNDKWTKTYNDAKKKNYNQAQSDAAKELQDNATKQYEDNVAKARESRSEAIQIDIDQAENRISNLESRYANATSLGEKNAISEAKYNEIAYQYDKEIAKAINDIIDAQERELKVQELQNQKAEELRKIKKQEFDDIQQNYENEQSLIEHNKKLLETSVSLLEAKGKKASESYYSAELVYQNQLIASQTQELNSLKAKLTEITPYTTEWWEATKAINAMEEAIADAEVSAQELQNTINNIRFEKFELFTDYVGNAIEELEFMQELLDEDDFFAKGKGDASITETGKAALSLIVSKRQANQELATGVLDEIKTLNEIYANDKDNTKYIEQRVKLAQQYEGYVKNVQSAWKEVGDLVEKQMDKIQESLSTIISEYENALDSAKDLRDFQKTINEKSQNINDLTKQVIALGGDTSQENQARLQKLQKDLSDANEDLSDTYYDRWLSDQKQMLTNLETGIEEYFNELDLNSLISKVIEDTQANGMKLEDIVKGINGIDTFFPQYFDSNSEGTIFSDTKGVIEATKGLVDDIYKVLDTESKARQEAEAKAKAEEAERQAKLAEEQAKASQQQMVDPTIMATPTPPAVTPNPSNGSSNTNTLSKREATLSEKLQAVNFPTGGIKQGEKNDTIALINQGLGKLGYTGLNSGKNYGDGTAKAVKKFCQDNSVNLDANGKTKASGKTMGRDFFKKLISVLKTKGYSKGGIVTKDDADLSDLGIRLSNGDTKLATVRVGESILTPVQTDNLQLLAKSLNGTSPIQNLINDNVIAKIPDFKLANNVRSGDVVIENIDIEMNGVNDPVTFGNQLANALNNDTRVKKILHTQVTTELTGGNSLSSRRF